MDLESGTTIYVEAETTQRVRLTVIYGTAQTVTSLTTEEALTLANALLGAVAELAGKR